MTTWQCAGCNKIWQAEEPPAECACGCRIVREVTVTPVTPMPVPDAGGTGAVVEKSVPAEPAPSVSMGPQPWWRRAHVQGVAAVCAFAALAAAGWGAYAWHSAQERRRTETEAYVFSTYQPCIDKAKALKAASPDRGEGFGAHLDALASACSGAEAAWGSKKQELCRTFLEKAQVELLWLDEAVPGRAKAAASRLKVDGERSAAEREKAAEYAAAAWASANAAFTKADGLREKGEFASALTAYGEAEARYKKASGVARDGRIAAAKAKFAGLFGQLSAKFELLEKDACQTGLVFAAAQDVAAMEQLATEGMGYLPETDTGRLAQSTARLRCYKARAALGIRVVEIEAGLASLGRDQEARQSALMDSVRGLIDGALRDAGDTRENQMEADLKRLTEADGNLKELEGVRNAAVQARLTAVEASKEAAAANAETHANELWQQGEKKYVYAATSFSNGRFSDSMKAWGAASDAYASAKARALAVQAYCKEKSEYESAVAANAVELEKNGRRKWADVQEQAKAAAVAADPLAGAEAYHHARAALRDALAESREAEHAALRSSVSRNASVSSGDEDPLFPLLGMTVGKSSRKDLALHKNKQKDDKYDVYKIEGLNFWYNGEDYFDSMYITHNEKEWPQKWIDNGFRPELSYTQWAQWLETHGFAVKIVKAPEVKTDQFPSFFAEVQASKKDAVPYTVELCFRYSKKTGKEDEGTLYSIGVKAISSLAGVRAQVAPDIAKRTKMIDLGSGVSMEMVWCPAGSFRMGNPESDDAEERAHHVTLTKGFWIGKYEVTQKQWMSVMGENPSKNKGDDFPVEEVSWTKCQEFVQKMNAKSSGGGFRLPTEAEWEYACRAGTEGSFAGILDEMGWYKENSNEQAHAVGLKLPNSWGVYDMHGNVQEWCQDWFGEYPIGSVKDPAGPSTGIDYRVVRGGSFCWCDGASSSYSRGKEVLSIEMMYNGVRLVMDGRGPD